MRYVFFVYGAKIRQKGQRTKPAPTFFQKVTSSRGLTKRKKASTGLCDERSVETCISLEALSRLTHPSLGPVSPDIFIGIAERSGKICDVGLRQFDRMCRFISDNPAIFETVKNVKFNMSPAELINTSHCNELVKTIDKYGIPYEKVQFEITETVATEYTKNIYNSIEQFKNRGLDLCLDDFGSGYANLNTVLKLPFSTIKLDRSLLSGIMEDKKAAVFYENIVYVLHNLGYNVISEGVETFEEKEQLKLWGVEMIQGYYYSKPLDDKKIVELLLENK